MRSETQPDRDKGTVSPHIARRLALIRHVALDMDGTIYSGSTLFAFTVPFLTGLRDMGIGYTFLTNNSSKSASDYLSRLKQFGIHATLEQLHLEPAHQLIGELADPDDREALKAAIRRALCRPRQIPEGLAYFSYENFRQRLQNIMGGLKVESVSPA